MNIWVGKGAYATEVNIENPKIGFRIENDWFNAIGADGNSIHLLRYNESKWDALTTTAMGKGIIVCILKQKHRGFHHLQFPH
jgi:PGF-pre-PGF domain-containing protein